MKFQQILEANITIYEMLEGWYSPQIINDPKLISKYTIDNLKKRRLEVLLWPSQWIGLKRGTGISQNWKTLLQKYRMLTISAHIKTLKRQTSVNNSSTI